MKLNPILSIRQPWVDLIMRGEKVTEIRSQRRKHVGELWIHSSKWEPGVDREEWSDIGSGITGHVVGKVTQLGSVSGADLRRYIDGEREHLQPIEVDRLDWIVQTYAERFGDLDPWYYASTDEDTWNLLVVCPHHLITPIPLGGKIGYFNAEIPDSTPMQFDYAPEVPAGKA